MITASDVLLHGTLVGELVRDDREQWRFTFNEAYRRHPQRPVLSQRFEDDLSRPYRGKRGGLPPFFANLLPEADGDLRPILEAHLGVPAGDDITLLELLGRDLPGAVELRQRTELRLPPSSLDPAIPPTEPHERDEEWLRFSIAGVQLKFSVLVADDRITLPAHGHLGDWLVKLDSQRFPHLCENEHAVLLWARHAGFEVPEVKLRPARDLVGHLGEYASPDSYVLAIRRYDRQGPAKIHQEDLAQVLGLLPRHKYDHASYDKLLVLLRTIVGEGATEELLRRIVLMIASGNADAHLKNWSLIYRDPINPELAPLYDQVATVAWPKEQLRRELALGLATVKRFSELRRETFEELAARAQIDRAWALKVLDQTLDQLARAWEEARLHPEWSMPSDHARGLREHWQRTPVLRDSPLGRLDSR